MGMTVVSVSSPRCAPRVVVVVTAVWRQVPSGAGAPAPAPDATPTPTTSRGRRLTAAGEPWLLGGEWQDEEQLLVDEPEPFHS